MKEQHRIAILCSGVALGVYIPGLLVNYQLRRRGCQAEVVTLENLVVEEKRNKINDNKQAFHKSFRVALAGQKMARDIRDSIDDNLLQELFDRWLRENVTHFIVFSGFWVTLLEEFRKFMYPRPIDVECCHMDADISASWKNAMNNNTGYRNSWLFKCSEKRIIQKLTVCEKKPLPFEERPNRVTVHGGGWGMGTYQSKIAELEERGLNLDIVAYNIEETKSQKPGNRYFMMDPLWAPWHKNSESEHEFPPFGQVEPLNLPRFINRKEYHELFTVIGQSKAIVSKPGGATLVDSLAAATPLIMLDPFGDYESKNAALWEELEFGILYAAWRDSNFSFDLLHQLHRNILEATADCPDYVESYIARITDLVETV